MALKPSITLRMGQQLRMTPQLQQAIKLLQLSSMDLEQEIQEVLDSNFMLEEMDPDNPDGESTSLDQPQEDTPSEADVIDQNALETDTQNNSGELETGDYDPSDYDPSDYDPSDHDSSGMEEPPPVNPEVDGEAIPDTSAEVSSESIADDLPVDTSWDDVFDETLTSATPGSDFSDENYLETRNAVSETIQSYLVDQLNLLNLTESDTYIAAAIVDGLNDEGILQIPLEDVLEFAPPEYELEIEEVEAVLHLIQHLDPLGIASRSLQECLAIQLAQLPDATPHRDTALQLVENHISLLANRDYTQLTRKMRIKDDELKETISLIQTLNPRPGSDIAADNTDYIEPDVLVSKQNGRWTVELNPKSAPRIRVNPEYASLIKRGDTGNDATNMKNHLQEARWFIKSLQQRNDTLLRVSTKIVEYQRGFLEYGEQAMKPLVLHDIAEAVELHESTISRVTTQKYMLTPAGVFELKYFFSSHVSTHTGGEVSSTAIRALIKKLVSEENTKKPLSDSKIAKLLAEQNINVARRTIAKYRELLLIPPSNERKQLI